MLNIWSILENVPCALRNVYFAAFGSNVLYKSIKSIQPNVSFKAIVSLLTFFLDDLYTDVCGVLISHTIIVMSISPFRSVSNCFIYLSVLMLFLSQITPFYVVNLLPNLSSYSYFYCLLPPSTFMLY